MNRVALELTMDYQLQNQQGHNEILTNAYRRLPHSEAIPNVLDIASGKSCSRSFCYATPTVGDAVNLTLSCGLRCMSTDDFSYAYSIHDDLLSKSKKSEFMVVRL